MDNFIDILTKAAKQVRIDKGEEVSSEGGVPSQSPTSECSQCSPPATSRGRLPCQTLLPPGGDPVTANRLARQVALCPHVIDTIVSFASHKTQIVCLRVSQLFHEAAGKIIYRCISMDTDDMRQIMQGFHIGRDINEDLSKCVFFHPKKTKSPHDKRAEHCPQPSQMPAVHPPPHPYMDIPTESPKQEPGSPPASKKKKKRTGAQRKKQKKHQKAEGPSSGAGATSQAAAPRRNFKAPLLKYVRVLSIGSHHHCLCSLYAPLVAELFSSLEVLCVVPHFVVMFKLDTFCDREDLGCPLIAALKPRKIVFRNMDGNGIPLPQWNLPSSVEEIVYVLPTDGRRFEGHGNEHLESLQAMWCYFDGVRRMKVIFHKDWEGWTKDDETVAKIIHGRCPVTPDQIVYPLSLLPGTTRTQIKLIGLEDLTYSANGDLVGIYQRLFPEAKTLSKGDLVQLVKRELRTGQLFAALSYGEKEFGEDPDIDSFDYFSKDVYDLYCERFPRQGCMGEINAED